MSETVAPPLVLFTTRTNTELGAARVELADDGSIVLRDVCKKVTENMLSSYPRAMLGHWTPNRAALRYPRDEIAERKVRRFEGGDPLDADALVALAG
jgi:hypothetical protein